MLKKHNAKRAVLKFYIVRKILAAKLEIQLNADFDLPRVTLDYCNLL